MHALLVNRSAEKMSDPNIRWGSFRIAACYYYCQRTEGTAVDGNNVQGCELTGRRETNKGFRQCVREGNPPAGWLGSPK